MKYTVNSVQKYLKLHHTAFTKLSNHIWNNNDIPRSWKQASVLLITKLDKPIEVQQITPINFVNVNQFFLKYSSPRLVNLY